MKYVKTGRLCFLSHLDLITVFQRAVVRAGIPVTFTEGYNPHPRIAFGPALPVGVESIAEYLDMETGTFVDLPKATGDLNAELPQGMRILEARVIPRNTPSLSASISRYTYRAAVPERYGSNLMDRIRIFMETPSLFVEKKGKRKDIKPFIEAIAPARGEEHPVLEITLQDGNGSKVRPVDVIEKLFAVGPGESSLFRITRTAVQAKAGTRWIDPMDTGHDRA